MGNAKAVRAVLCCAFAFTSRAALPTAKDPLQACFDHMYNLSFADAHRCFENWEQVHPKDPRGPVFDAAAYLFSEFDRLRILQSQFFVDDRNFNGKKDADRLPDPEVKRSFEQALARSKSLADSKLRVVPDDKAALFSTVMRLGLKADYDALIEKQNLQALNETKEARRVAQDLLALYPTCYDAYIAEGVENYLLSQKAAPLRWILHVTGAQTDKDTGIAKLRLTASKGEYLQPFAQLLLAVAALRDKNDAEAQRLLSDLSERFPGNRLYREELQKLK
ncbi:MAG: hypothetical protein JO210_12875 [Acidobacteriaceae bacterium]|nr:hypothetical protein [Acidobacteriaceae bacterium]